MLVVITAVIGLTLPEVGKFFAPAVTPLLALLIFVVSLTFDAEALVAALRRPSLQVLATLLVYVPMSLAALVIASLLFGSGPLWLGIVLLGTLPTDISSPLLVFIGRGNVSLASVFNAVNTALAPLVVPLLFLTYTGIELDVAVGALIVELTVTVLVPTIAGIAIRTWRPRRILPIEPLLSATGGLCYLMLLMAVIGPNAATILADPGQMGLVVIAALVLNVTGYAIAAGANRLVVTVISPTRFPLPDRVAMLFTVSKKEFSIAAVVVFSSGLAAEVALPAVIYAVVQMLTSPVVATRLARRSTTALRRS